MIVECKEILDSILAALPAGTAIVDEDPDAIPVPGWTSFAVIPRNRNASRFTLSVCDGTPGGLALLAEIPVSM